MRARRSLKFGNNGASTVTDWVFDPLETRSSPRVLPHQIWFFYISSGPSFQCHQGHWNDIDQSATHYFLVVFHSNYGPISCRLRDNKLCGRPQQYAPASCKLTSDLLTLKVVSESRVMRATSVPISAFLGLSCSQLPTYSLNARDHFNCSPLLFNEDENLPY